MRACYVIKDVIVALLVNVRCGNKTSEMISFLLVSVVKLDISWIHNPERYLHIYLELFKGIFVPSYKVFSSLSFHCVQDVL